MKFSYSTTFSRLVLLVFIALNLLMIGGRYISTYAEPLSIMIFPFLFHPISVGFAGFLILLVLIATWRYHRDHQLLLPLSTVIATIFFTQAFIGAGNLVISTPQIISTLHTVTSILLWLALLGLVIGAGLFSRKPQKEFSPLDVKQRLKDFIILSKPIIVLLLLVTTYAGMVIGSRSFPPFSLTLWTLLGGALTASGSGAINQYIDRNLDKLMQRTAKRPLAAGRMFPAEGLAYGLSISIIGVYILVVFVNLLAASLAIAGILYYVILYSLLLKNASVHNVVIGGGAGAIPPLVGWAAVTGTLDIAAWALFAIIFFWTPPHFWALAIVRKKDYERVGTPMLPVVRGVEETRKQILIYTIGLVIFTLLVPMLSVAGNFYFIASLILGGGLIYTAWRVYKIKGNKVAWQMYRISSMYLAFIFLALMIDSVI